MDSKVLEINRRTKANKNLKTSIIVLELKSKNTHIHKKLITFCWILGFFYSNTYNLQMTLYLTYNLNESFI